MREEREGENRFALSHAGANRGDPFIFERIQFLQLPAEYTRCRFATVSNIAGREGEGRGQVQFAATAAGNLLLLERPA